MKTMLEGKRVIIGVSGGISAYKACILVSALKQAGADTHVLMTEHAEKFIGRATFEALTGHRVIKDTFESEEYLIPHIQLARTADLFMIAPATANIIAKVANGIADDMLTSTFLACNCPKIVVPAMNVNMYNNPATLENIERLKQRGIEVLEPVEGHLAEGISAKGKLPEPAVLYRAIERTVAYGKDLCGKKIVITAGATREALDPVRFITNHSTGKMGYALAKVAKCRGAEVTVISGKVNRLSDSVETSVFTGIASANGVMPMEGVKYIEIESAADMLEAVRNEYEDADCIIMSAAVADFRPKTLADNKIKKNEMELNEDGTCSLKLERTTDILKWVGERKKDNQILVGFSMETENLIENSAAKLEKKNADMIVANSLRVEGAGFGTDTNKVTLITREDITELPLMSKEETALNILDEIFSL